MNRDILRFRIWSEKLKRYYWSYAITVDGDLVPWTLGIGSEGEDPGSKLTVFDHITASIEVLVEKFIFKEWHPIARRYVWYSLLLNSEERLIYAPAFDTKAEAFDATVAKLKEVYNETTST